MRPFADLSERARSWYWYGIVRAVADRPDDAMDALFLPAKASGRRRHFRRIRDTGSSPKVHALVDGKTLLVVVDSYMDGALRPFAGAKPAFESIFWEFLGIPGQPAERYSRYIAEQAESRAWYRIGARELGLYRTVLGPDAACTQPVGSTAYSAMLHRLLNDDGIDALAMLAALFREALNGVLLAEAMQIQQALRVAVVEACQRIAMPDLGARLLRKLVDDRILANTWLTIGDWPEVVQLRAGRSSRQRARDLNAFVDWYVSPDRSTGISRYGAFPLVPRSVRIDWLEANREFLDSAVAYYHALRIDAEGRRLRQPERAQELLAHAGEVLASLHVPPALPDEAFFNTPPPRLLGRLPSPY